MNTKKPEEVKAASAEHVPDQEYTPVYAPIVRIFTAQQPTTPVHLPVDSVAPGQSIAAPLNTPEVPKPRQTERSPRSI